MNAKVVVEFILENVCDHEDIKLRGFADFNDIVRWLIREEGLFGIITDHPEGSTGAGGKIISIKAIK